MTNLEAADLLDNLIGMVSDNHDSDYDEALSKGRDILKSEPCEDCISRQAVIDACDQSINLFEAVDRIKELPPVTPQPKTGYWIVEVWNNKEHHTCSSCQHVVDYEPCYHYCPYCGAKMVEPQESEK